MREIKFRAWDTKKQMMSGNKLALTINTREWRLHNEPVPYLLERNVERVWEGVPTQRYILMQFTGLHDKNGKEIYEGDILSNGLENDTVEWSESDASFIIANGTPPLDRTHYWHDNAKIIGNIYQNPELLK